MPALVAGLALLAHAAGSLAGDQGAVNRFKLPVLVSETAATVRLQVILPDDVPPGSVEVQLSGRKVVVLAQGTDGRRLRSRSLHVSEDVMEDGAQADYEPDGTLVLTLQKAPRGGT
jgi:HSP20 family molecular chaperone IbpA